MEKEWDEEDIKELSKIPTLNNPNWIPESKKGNELIKYVLELFNNHIDIIMKIINKNLLILSNSEKDRIYQSYQKLFNLNRFKLIAPQPVTLNNLDNILQKYVVTEKADGDRYILYIINKSGYLINKKKEIIDTGIKFNKLEGECILDGEYLDDLKLYLIFDIYIYNNEKVYEFPWLGDDLSRSILLKEFESKSQDKELNEIDSVKIGFKRYEVGTKNKSKLILEKCEKVLNKKYNYKIDGLIFLPMNMSVKSVEEGVAVKDINGTWDLNYKWKPEKENTIDFLVKIKKDKGRDIYLPYMKNDTIHYYKTIELYVGYNFNDDMNINYSLKVLNNRVYSKLERSKIILFNPDDSKILHTTNIPLIDGKMICEKDNKEITNNSLVEMRYNPNGKNGMLWEPLRIRSDKTEPQYFKVANNVWKTIMNPITDNMIIGKEEFKYIPSETDKDLYYLDNYDMVIYTSEPLKRQWNLYNQGTPKKIRLEAEKEIGVCTGQGTVDSGAREQSRERR